MGILNSWRDRIAKACSNADEVSNAGRDVLIERHRQLVEEGWTTEHDDEHELGEMAMAASCYAEQSCCSYDHPQPDILDRWPWSGQWWKPKGPRQDLVRAAALIIAEIERLDRASS
jgi:hypothetical protein